MKPLPFPAGFTWGVATAAPQIEGAAFADGKSQSVWDTFARRPGAVLNVDTLDTACDQYHRFDADFALMRKLGIRNYRQVATLTKDELEKLADRLGISADRIRRDGWVASAKTALRNGD